MFNVTFYFFLVILSDSLVFDTYVQHYSLYFPGNPIRFFGTLYLSSTLVFIFYGTPIQLFVVFDIYFQH